MKNIFLTGATGFLGQHLARRLGKVIAIPHAKLSTYKLKDPAEVYFLSSYGNMSFHKETDRIIKANVLDLINIVKQLPGTNIKSFVFISTSSVKLPIQTTYSRAKKAAEEILLAYMEKYHLPICIIRPYTIIGVGDHKEHLVPVLIRSCYTDEMVNFVQSPCHDYIDVEDVVDGILTLSGRGVKGIFELGSGFSHSNQHILDLVEKATGKKANINLINQLYPYDTDNWVSNNFRARGYGWMPRKSLEQSIKEMVKNYE